MGFHHKFCRNLQEVEKPVLNLVRNNGDSKIITGRSHESITHWQDHSGITLYDYRTG